MDLCLGGAWMCLDVMLDWLEEHGKVVAVRTLWKAVGFVLECVGE